MPDKRTEEGHTLIKTHETENTPSCDTPAPTGSLLPGSDATGRGVPKCNGINIQGPADLILSEKCMVLQGTSIPQILLGTPEKIRKTYAADHYVTQLLTEMKFESRLINLTDNIDSARQTEVPWITIKKIWGKIMSFMLTTLILVTGLISLTEGTPTSQSPSKHPGQENQRTHDSPLTEGTGTLQTMAVEGRRQRTTCHGGILHLSNQRQN